MYSKYYEPLPDADAYLARIGMQRPTKLTKEYLDALVFAHQCTVPFENIDICERGKSVSIATQDLYNKIVVNKRGGYCFELNGLFVLLLRALGFDAYSCPCRVMMGPASEKEPGPVMHRGTIVNLDGKKLFCDVGFGGPMPHGSVEIVDGVKQIQRGDTFWFDRIDEYWWILKREAVDPETGEQTAANTLCISTGKWEPVDYLFANQACSEGPEAFFGKMAMVNLCYEDGHASLNDHTLTVMQNGERIVREISKDELYDVLAEYFNLVVE